MRLYELSWGIYPRRVIIYAAEKGIALERVALKEGENRRPAFLALNPSGSTPVLEIEAGVAIRQSTSIIEYLEETQDGPDLIGRTPLERAVTRDFVSLLNEAYCAFALYAANASALFDGRYPQDPAVAIAMRDRYRLLLGQVEALTGDGPFLSGERLSFADCILFASAQFAAEFYREPLPIDYPRLRAQYDGFARRPSAARPDYPDALARLAPLLASA